MIAARLTWWRDTLFTRLFLLMLAALLGSHLVAWLVVTQWALPALHQPALERSPPALGGPPLPPLGTLPPTPGLPTAGPVSTGVPAALPPAVLALDYGIRILLIALAAGWGARWVAAPVRRMVAAAQTLSDGVALGQAPDALDETRGTSEVREAARVFNRMAQRLVQQFRGRGLLMASISHDLRTPLTRMRMRLENLSPPALAQRCIADIREMNELIDGAISVFRADDPADEPLQATDLFALVQALTDDLAEAGQAVQLQGHSLVALAKPSALRRAVGNLIGNSLRYGGSAEVTVLALGGARILVEDRGPGIPLDQMQQVLEPFHRVEASRSRDTGGSGLGLHIAQSLLLSQGASLELAPRPGGGLRAEIRLQAAPSR